MARWKYSIIVPWLSLATAVDAILIPRAPMPSVLTIPLKNFGNQHYAAAVRMGPDSRSQEFNFALSMTSGYTVVAGRECTTCVNSTAPKYDQSLSSTFAPPTNTSLNSLSVNGANVTGQLGTERCALGKEDGSWWVYDNQKIFVASSGVIANGGNISGIAGFGQTNVLTPTDSLLGQFFKNRESQNTSSLAFGLALQPVNQDGSDTSGGELHLFGASDQYYTGNFTTLPVVSYQQQQEFGPVPPQIGSYDWTCQMQGWSFLFNGAGASGGNGTYATVEPAYPYMMLSQADAIRIYSTIPGSRRDTYITDSLAFIVPCDMVSTASLTVNFAGLSVSVDPSELVTKVGDTCYGNVRGWSDPNRNTYIMGSAFIRNIYLLYTASKDQQSNSIGFASRLQAKKGGKEGQAGVIAGSVVGGILFIALLVIGLLIWLRRKQNKAAVAGGGESTHHEKSLFGFGSSKEHDPSLVADPWIPPEATGGSGTMQVYRDPRNGDQLTVGPWVDRAPVDDALLAPDPNIPVSTTPPPSQPQPQRASITPPQQLLAATFATPPHTSGSQTTTFPSPPGSPGFIEPPSGGIRDSTQYAAYRPLSTTDPFMTGGSPTPLGANGQGGWGAAR